MIRGLGPAKPLSTRMSSPTFEVVIENKTVIGVADTGANISAVSLEFSKRLPNTRVPWSGGDCYNFDNSVHRPYCLLKDVAIEFNGTVVYMDMAVIDGLVPDAILGIDYFALADLRVLAPVRVITTGSDPNLPILEPQTRKAVDTMEKPAHRGETTPRSEENGEPAGKDVGPNVEPSSEEMAYDGTDSEPYIGDSLIEEIVPKPKVVERTHLMGKSTVKVTLKIADWDENWNYYDIEVSPSYPGLRVTKLDLYVNKDLINAHISNTSEEPIILERGSKPLRLKRLVEPKVLEVTTDQENERVLEVKGYDPRVDWTTAEECDESYRIRFTENLNDRSLGYELEEKYPIIEVVNQREEGPAHLEDECAASLSGEAEMTEYEPRIDWTIAEECDEECRIRFMENQNDPSLGYELEDKYPVVDVVNRREEYLSNFEIGEMPPEHRAVVENFLCDYRDVFFFPGDPIGTINVWQHRIESADALPIRHPPYQTSMANKDKIEEIVKRLLGQASQIVMSTRTKAAPKIFDPGGPWSSNRTTCRSKYRADTGDWSRGSDLLEIL